MDIKFTGKKTKIGNSQFVLIPKAIAELLDDGVYMFIIQKRG